jgi:hypothetical protein
MNPLTIRNNAQARARSEPEKMNKRKKPKTASTKLTEDESMVLWPFLDFAEEGDDAFARYLLHCGIDGADIGRAGDAQGAILKHYRRPDGTYDVDTAARDLARWPPIAERVKELKRKRRAQVGT